MKTQVQVSSVEGNFQLLDGGAMFGNTPRPVWEKWCPSDGRGRIRLACRALLIETEGLKILCETGIGNFFEPKLADRFGVESPERHILLDNLRALNISHEDIDIVILSHLHFDHAGGLLSSYSAAQPGSTLLFPKAQFMVGQEAFERALRPHPRDRASFIPGLTDKLQASGRLVIVDDQRPATLPLSISFFKSEGHTPGQMHTVVKGSQSTLVFCGDLVPGCAWIHIPITMGYDRFAEQVINEKIALYERSNFDHCYLFFTHDADYAAAKIAKDSTGRYLPSEKFDKLIKTQL